MEVKMYWFEKEVMLMFPRNTKGYGFLQSWQRSGLIGEDTENLGYR